MVMNCKWCARGECWDHAPAGPSPLAAAAGGVLLLAALSKMQSRQSKDESKESSSSWDHGVSNDKPSSSLRDKRASLVVNHKLAQGAAANGKRVFGFRGDSLMFMRTEGRKRKFKSFQMEIENAFRDAFDVSTVDYKPCIGDSVRNIASTIEAGPNFEILCVGIGINDLLDPKTEKVRTVYPSTLDNDLRSLASAVKNKSTKSLFLLAGAASIWNYPRAWDVYMVRVCNTLKTAGMKVIPLDECTAVMSQMPLNSDKMHFLEDEDSKKKFAAAWVEWLNEHVFAADNNTSKKALVSQLLAHLAANGQDVCADQSVTSTQVLAKQTPKRPRLW